MLALAYLPALALPEDSEQPLSIDADSITYDDDPNGTHELSGNVRFRQGTLQMEADRVVATKKDDKLYRVVATGEQDQPVSFRQRPSRDEELVQGRAQTVDYGIAEQRAKLTGDAFLSTGKREYTGGTIVWDMKENRVDCQAGCQYTELPPPAD